MLVCRQKAGRTFSTPRLLFEVMKNPRGAREGEARRSAEAPEGKRQNPSRVGGVLTTTRLQSQPLMRTPRVYKLKFDGEFAARAKLAFNAYLPARFPANLFDHGKPQSEAAVFSAVRLVHREKS